MRIFPTATAAFKNARFIVNVPAYTADMPADVVNGTFSPIYSNSGSYNMERSSKTSEQLVHLFSMKVPFTIVRDLEVIECLSCTDNYINEVSAYAHNSPSIPDYLLKVKPFREAIYKLYQRLIKKNPEWKKEFDTEPEILSILSKLGANMGADTKQAPAVDMKTPVGFMGTAGSSSAMLPTDELEAYIKQFAKGVPNA